MADAGDHPPSEGGSGSQPSSSQASQRKGRRGTRLRELTLSRSGDQRIPIEFDPATGNPLGPNKAQFKSYVALLARSKASILKKDWDDVELRVKEQIWETILLTFEVPNTEAMKRKWLSHAAERWRGFKSSLTRRYVFGDRKDVSPCSEYQFLDEDTWQKFVESRNEPAFLEKRRKAQEITAKNLYPHRLSRGGYEKLEERMVAEKATLLQEAASADPSVLLSPPSPPKRHEKWKRARQRASGDFTSEPSRAVAQRIDSLVEQSSQGTFVPHGREDILTAAIGTPEHPGRVRAIGRGVGIRQYYGPPPAPSLQSKLTPAEMSIIVEQVRQQVMASFGYSEQPSEVPVPQPTARKVSTKGSCSPTEDEAPVEDQAPVEDEAPVEDPPIQFDHLSEVELYVEDPLTLVAVGKVYVTGSTVHHKEIADDNIRVAVDRVIDGDAPVPIATDEVVLVSHAPSYFIQWPKSLVKPCKDKKAEEDHLKRLCVIAFDLGDRSVPFKLISDIVGKDSAIPFYITKKDLLELAKGDDLLNISIIQLWMRYVYESNVQKANAHLYGFLDPQLIQGSGNTPDEIKNYMVERLQGDKKFYIAPYHSDAHWQLIIICPSENLVVFLCSLHKKPKKAIMDPIEVAMNTYHLMQGKHSSQIKKPTWILPKGPKQKGSWECGYYVMRHMNLIVSASIVDSWFQVFSNPASLCAEEIDEIRISWAKYFMEVTNL